MSLLALATHDTPNSGVRVAAGSIDYIGGIDLELYADMSSNTIFGDSRLGTVYGFPGRDFRSTLQSAKELCIELITARAAGLKIGANVWAELGLLDAEFARSADPVTCQKDTPKLSAKIDEWLSNVNNLDAACTVPAVYKTISALLDSLEEDGIDKVNEALNLVEIETVSAQHVIAVLRSLSRMKDKMPAWRPLEANVRIELKAREAKRDKKLLDIDLIMRGLNGK